MLKPIPSTVLAALAGLLATSCGFAATYVVANATDFNNLPNLNAGDVVQMSSGSYGALNKTLVSTIADDPTAQTDPIIVYALTNGGVAVTAPSQIVLQGRGIILAGLDFKSTSGMIENGSTSPASLVRFGINSRYCVLSNVRFENCNVGDTYGYWVLVNGFNHTIEYCSFSGKTSLNTTIAFSRSTSEAGITVQRNHRLRYCYFGPRECDNQNGWEGIRLGDSSSQAHDMNITVERNVFYRTIWNSAGNAIGDMEIISNKSKGNKFHSNTFLESYGQLTLRHGDSCIVDGNFFLGGGFYSGSQILFNPPNDRQTGVRIIGQNHVVRNNYFVNLRGTNARAALVVVNGYPNFNDGNGTGGNNTYEAAHHAEIYNNTFLDCRQMALGFASDASSNVLPTGVKIYNNAWQGSGTGTNSGIYRASGSFAVAGSGGNYIYHPDSGSLGWNGLGGTYSSTVSPDVSVAFNHYKIPSGTSPLLDAADPTLVAATDIRGLARPATAASRDIGAFELEVAGTGNAPLLRNQVGPGFDGGPSGTYPTPDAMTPVAAPLFNPPAGTYSTAQSATITTATNGASIRYTLDGSTPTSTSGTIYTSPVSIATSTTLKAIAYLSGMQDSAVSTANYTIGAGSPPAAPTGLTATGGNAQVSLSWTASTGATSYNVKRATVSGGPYGTIAGNITGTTHVDSNVTNGATYYYVVTAVNANGESGDSSQASATPAAAATTLHVANIAVDRVSAGGGMSRAQAVVTIVDATGSPVANANVTVQFSQAIGEIKSGITNASGVVTITTTGTAANPAKTTGCVSTVTHASLTYNPAANVKTCDNSY